MGSLIERANSADDPKFIYASTAVALHKYVLSFCVGLELWTSGKNTSAINISYILVYAIMSPIGIAVGKDMNKSRRTNNSI